METAGTAQASAVPLLVEGDRLFGQFSAATLARGSSPAGTSTCSSTQCPSSSSSKRAGARS